MAKNLSNPRPLLKLFQHQSKFVRHYSAPTSGSIPEAKQKYIPTSGTYPQGFLVSSTHVGVKASNKIKDDIALIGSTKPCTAAAVFTKNIFQAAPVSVTREMLLSRKNSGISGVVVNSGCANAVTGKGGMEDAVKMGEEASRCLAKVLESSSHQEGQSPSSNSTIVMSTGVIGQRLPIDKIIGGIPTATETLGDTHEHWLKAATAICTTDTFPKLISTSFTIPASEQPGSKERTYRLAGMTKGAGMIQPNMATLLGIVCTDASVEPATLQAALKSVIPRSFNSISIDGDTSTNDTVALLANGAALEGENSASHPDYINSTEHGAYPAFCDSLSTLCKQLAQLIVRDGEGATKFITIRVRNAPHYSIAHDVAKTIATSPLVKTAMYGRDANWGRILCAIGYTQQMSKAKVKAEEVSVSFVGKDGEELRVVVNGEPQLPIDEEKAARMLAEEDIEILVRLGEKNKGKTAYEVVYWTCDFSHEYVTINGDYRT